MAALYFDATGLAYSFDDGHIAVRTVHSVKHVPTHQSSITRHGKVALSVKYVAADLSSITTVPSGTDCQICHELRHHILRHRKSRLLLHSMEPGIFVVYGRAAALAANR